MNPPRVSVIVPSYNHAAYIGAALDSALAQTVTDREVLVVDDGSTDGSVGAIAPYLDRVRFLPRPHAGIAATYNAGVAAVHGTYIAFLESDDLWDAGYLEATVGFLEANPWVGAVTTARRVIDAAGRPTGVVLVKRSSGPFYTTANILLRDWGSAVTPVVRRHCLEEVGSFDARFRFGCDTDMWLRFSLRHPIAHMPQPLYLYRLHGRNTTRSPYEASREALEVAARFAREQAGLTLAQRRAVRRCLGTLYGRVGRLLLESSAPDGPPPGEVERLFAQALRHDPWRPRHVRRYLALKILGPRASARLAWRRGDRARPPTGA